MSCTQLSAGWVCLSEGPRDCLVCRFVVLVIGTVVYGRGDDQHVESHVATLHSEQPHLRWRGTLSSSPPPPHPRILPLPPTVCVKAGCTCALMLWLSHSHLLACLIILTGCLHVPARHAVNGYAVKDILIQSRCSSTHTSCKLSFVLVRSHKWLMVLMRCICVLTKALPLKLCTVIFRCCAANTRSSQTSSPGKSLPIPSGHTLHAA